MARCISRLCADPRRSGSDRWAVLRDCVEGRRDPTVPLVSAFEVDVRKMVSIPAVPAVRGRRAPGPSVGDQAVGELDPGDSGCEGTAIVEERARRVLGEVEEISEDVEEGESIASWCGYGC